MAFGSFFKKIINGAKNIIGKIVPAIKKGLETVSKIAPAIATGAAAFGGPIGATIGSVADTVGKVAGGISQFLNNPTSKPPLPSGRVSQSSPANNVRLGANGAGRFAVPMLK